MFSIASTNREDSNIQFDFSAVSSRITRTHGNQTQGGQVPELRRFRFSNVHWLHRRKHRVQFPCRCFPIERIGKWHNLPTSLCMLFSMRDSVQSALLSSGLNAHETNTVWNKPKRLDYYTSSSLSSIWFCCLVIYHSQCSLFVTFVSKRPWRNALLSSWMENPYSFGSYTRIGSRGRHSG